MSTTHNKAVRLPLANMSAENLTLLVASNSPLIYTDVDARFGLVEATDLSRCIDPHSFVCPTSLDLDLSFIAVLI